MRPFRDRPIRQKVTLLILLALVAGLALTAAAVTVYEVTTFRPRALRDVTTLAAIVRANTVPAVLFNDPTAARENLATLRSRREIGAAVVYRKDGSEFASYQRDGGPTMTSIPPSDLGAVFRPDQLVLTLPLESDGQPLGSLRLQYVLPSLLERLPQYAIMTGVVLAALSAAAILLLTTLSRSVSTPLLTLAGAVRQLTLTRDLRIRVPKHAEDEIGSLTSAFNQMLDTLQERQETLQQGAAALRESEARLRLALSAASMDTWVLRLPAFPGDRRRTPSNFTDQGQLAGLLSGIHPEDRQTVEAAISQAITEQGSFEVEFRTAGDGHEQRFTALRGQAYLDEDGLRPQLIGVVQDVTDRRHLEHQLLQAQKMEAIGNLAGGIAHDFNNLLTGMIGYLKFVQSSLPQGTQVRADVDEVERAARRAAALTAQLLSYARRQMVVPTLVDLNEAVRSLDQLLRRLLGENIAIVVELAPALWPARVDQRQLEQVVLNLAVNARDAMAGGGRLTISTHNTTIDAAEARRSQVQAGQFVELRVADTGTGMTPELVARIFEPFFTTKAVGQGTGLGLAMCYGIVKQAEGHLLVQSEVGRGSTFRVLLPHAAVAAPELAAPATEGADAPRGHETILVVEDEAAVRALVARALREAGYTVLEAANGAVAEDVAREHVGELALLVADVVMPGISGRELADNLRGLRPGLLVLFMSGYTEDIVVRQGVQRAEVPFLAKPFTPSELLQAVRGVLDGSRVASL